MENILTSKIGEGWSGFIYLNESVICFGAYVNKKGNLITPTLYYAKKTTVCSLHEVKKAILSLKPSPDTKDFISNLPLSNYC